MINNFIIFDYNPKFMQQSTIDAPCENEFYDHLAQLIHIFKAIILGVDRSITALKNEGDCEQEILQVRKILENSQAFIKKFNMNFEPLTPFHSAYQRFMCRLVQNLAPCKAKLNNDQCTILLAEEYFLGLENCLNYFKKQRNTAKLFIRVFKYTQTFCQGCQMLMSCCGQEEAAEIMRKQASQQKEECKIQSDSKNNLEKQPIFQPESNFQKVMAVFNKRYSTINCLDVDYASLKNYYFMSKSQNEASIFKEYIIRNNTASKAISRYNRHFSQFIRKKEKIQIKKTRIQGLKQRQKNSEPKEESSFIEPRPIIGNRFKISCKNNAYEKREQKTEYSLPISLPALRDQQSKKTLKEETQQQKMKRDHYQLKNVYLTIDKTARQMQEQAQNRFLFNYSLQRPKQSSKFSNGRASPRLQNENFSIISAINHKKQINNEINLFNSILQNSKIDINPRINVIHRFHIQRKNDKKGIRITNVVFKGNHRSKILSVINPESITIS